MTVTLEVNKELITESMFGGAGKRLIQNQLDRKVRDRMKHHETMADMRKTADRVNARSKETIKDEVNKVEISDKSSSYGPRPKTKPNPYDKYL